MTAAQTYTVDVVFHGKDQGAQATADHLGSMLSGLQGRLDSVASGMERMAMVGVAAVGGVAVMGVRALTREMVQLNSRTEDTTIGIAGMLQANGGAQSFAAGMSQASAVLQRIRTDADALPGEAEDFVRVFSVALPAALQAGMRSAMDVSQFTNQFTAVGIALNVDADQAGRDLRLMLQGRAGAQVSMWNQLQSLVGKTAEEFNQMSAPQRLAALQGATGRYADMVHAFGGTFTTAMTTVTGKAHRLIEIATKPLFDRAVTRLQELGGYMTAHGPEIEDRMKRWGEAGARGFDMLFDRGKHAVTWLRENWRSLASDVEAAGRRAVAVYAIARTGSAAISLASGVANVAGLAGAGAGAARAAGVVGAGAGASALAPAAAIGAGVTVTGGLIALADRNGIVSVRRSLQELREPAQLAGERLHFLWTRVEPLAAAMGGALLTVVTTLAGVVLRVVTVFSDIVSIVPTFYNWLRLLTSAPDTRGGAQQSEQFATNEDFSRTTEAMRDHTIRAVRSSAMVRTGGDRTTPHPAAAKHHTTIHNNFRIEQADNPERVAMSVMHVIQRELRNPTQSARPGLTTLRP